MNTIKNAILSLAAIFFAVVMVTFVAAVFEKTEAEAEETIINLDSSYKYDFELEALNDVEFPPHIYKDEGYNTLDEWWTALKTKRNSFEGVAEDAITELGEYATEEQAAALRNYSNKLAQANSFAEIQEYEDLLNATIEEVALVKANAESAWVSQVATNNNSYVSNVAAGVLTKSGGVNYYNGYRETYYSSNVLYHYMTPQWTCGADGVWRDSDGYIVVASSDLAYGSKVDTSLGAGKVYDSGCASGTLDLYTQW